jgi:SAM-dependent methyltransferase
MTEEMNALKNRLRETWSSGDYGIVARELEKSAEAFLARIPFDAGTRLLDVACGTGQIAFPAARRGARVTGVDIAPNLVAQARERVEKEGVEVSFDEGDAEQLPYEDGSFDLVVTLIGAMFAPRPERVAAELARVCRPGGRIVMGNWTPEGFIGSMFKTVAKHAPPPPIMPSPLMWGKEDVVRERLRDSVADLQMTRRMYPFHYPFSPAGVVEHYETYFGPTIQALARLDAGGQAALRADLEALWSGSNQAGDGVTHVDAELLEVVATRA